MKNLMTFCFLLAMALPLAAVEDGEVMYVGGTVPAVRAGSIGRFDTTSEASMTFEYGNNKLAIPYAAIQSFQYTTEVTHHLGVLPAIVVALLKARERRHFFRISYRDVNDAGQAVVFEVPNKCRRRSRRSSRPALRKYADHIPPAQGAIEVSN